jgi:hypothetical protein
LVLTRCFHQYIIHSLMGLSKEQMGWYFQESRNACLTKKRQVDWWITESNLVS